jgi:hypothetical protein
MSGKVDYIDMLGSLTRYARANWILVVLLAATAYLAYHYFINLKTCHTKLHVAIQQQPQAPKEGYAAPPPVVAAKAKQEAKPGPKAQVPDSVKGLAPARLR